MYRKSMYFISSVLVIALPGSISWGLENHNALQEESIIDANLAHAPEPPDGAKHEDTWVALSWTVGSSATSHDVYFGENFDNVDAGTGGTFQGNQAGTYFVVGLPGVPYSGGLVPGTTYYWCFEEVDQMLP